MNSLRKLNKRSLLVESVHVPVQDFVDLFIVGHLGSEDQTAFHSFFDLDVFYEAFLPLLFEFEVKGFDESDHVVEESRLVMHLPVIHE